MAKVWGCRTKICLLKRNGRLEEAESGEIAQLAIILVALGWGMKIIGGRVEMALSGHVRNRHTFIPPLCKEKGAGLQNVSE
jgi:hypothetical protein